MKFAFSLVFFLSFTALSIGQFAPKKEINEQRLFGTLKPGDFDGDGDIDFVCSFSPSDDFKLGWYESLGHPSQYKRLRGLVVPFYNVHSVYIADLNSDTIPDIVASGTMLTWFENVGGDTVFKDAQIITSSTSKKVIPSDIDVDGDNDLIVEEQSNVVWYENLNGLGSFGSKNIIFPITSSIKDIQAADIDKDGDADVISSNSSTGEILWYENEDGLGNFGVSQVITMELTGPRSLHFSDIDGDGDLDMIGTSYTGQLEIAWFENEDGAGAFGTKKAISTAVGLGQFLSSSDMDGDGDLDIVAGSGGSDGNFLAWFENTDGQGSFGSQTSIYQGDYDLKSSSIIDLDGDTDLDILATHKGAYWFENNDGLGQFDEGKLIDDYISGWYMIRVGDVDEDGDQDILLGAESDSALVWIENLDSLGNFGGIKIIDNGPSSMKDLLFEDMDGDGHKDIVASWHLSGSGSGIQWYRNYGNGSGFAPSQQVAPPASVNPEFISNADIDGDGDWDILYYKNAIPRLGWIENESGIGDFGENHVIYDQTINIDAFQTADLDKDDDTDILVGVKFWGDEDSYIAWFENVDGPGNNWQLHTISSDVDDLTYIHLADLDNDGDQDVLSCSLTENKIVWYENNNGIFGSQNFISSGIDGPYFLDDADIDLDGDLDIIALYYYANKILWFENIDGSGTFGGENPIWSFSGPPREIYAADIDGDGDNDVIGGLGSITWHENLSQNAQVVATCFLDNNQNSLYETDELILKNQQIHLIPSFQTSWTNNQGQVHFLTGSGQHQLFCTPSSQWAMTTDSVYTILINQDSSGQKFYNFGLKPVAEISNAQIVLTSGPTRCGFTVPFWLHYENTGTLNAQGLVSLEFDSLVTLVNAEPMPDSIEGNQYFWFFQNLNPTYSNQIFLNLQMPDVTFIGEMIELKSQVVLQENGVSIFENTHTFSSQINCSFDPNDKIVEPNVPGNDNYTLLGDTLVYTIRFQNTGTDTAINIRIEDYLDSYLDWSTFRVIAASHPFEVYLNENGKVEFYFDNIYLPDSIVNEVASHGFIKYRMTAMDSLLENTVIRNQASIFFDFNPPVVTEWISSIMVSEYPVFLQIQNPLCHESSNGSILAHSISGEDVFYLWDNGQTTNEISGLVAGQYGLTVTNVAGEIVADTFGIIISPDQIVLTTSSSPAIVNQANGTATVLAEGGIPPFSFTWDTQPTQTLATAIGLTAGTYSVTAIDSNGCMEHAEIIVEELVNVAESVKEWQFEMLPNPSLGSVVVSFLLTRPTNWSLKVHHANGQLIKSYNAPNNGSSASSLQITGLAEGVYTLSLHADGQVLSKKLVVSPE